MNYEDLLFDKKEGIATITLNRPEVLNALGGRMGESLSLALDEIAKDDEVKVAILTGAGRGFCSGADVRSQEARSTGAVRESHYQRLGRWGGGGMGVQFIRLHKPVIAAINGVCAGAGFSLALGCDIRIASEAARFVTAFINRGLNPDNGMTYYLPRVVGMSKALELMFTGEIIDAKEAERVGIVSRVVPHDELMKVTQELASKIAQKSPSAVGLTKRLAYQSVIGDLARYTELEGHATQWCARTEDYRQAVRAFAERRQ